MRPGLEGNAFANSNSPRVRIESARGAWVSRDTCQQFPSRFMPLMFLRLAPQSRKGKPYPQVFVKPQPLSRWHFIWFVNALTPTPCKLTKEDYEQCYCPHNMQTLRLACQASADVCEATGDIDLAMENLHKATILGVTEAYHDTWRG